MNLNLPRFGPPVLICLLTLASPRAHGADDEFETTAAKWLKPMNWVCDSEQPCISLGETGQFDDTHVFCPCVILQDGEYWLYYSGSQNEVVAKGVYKPRRPLTDAEKKKILAVVDRDRIYKVGLATSKDGVHFTKSHKSPVFSFGDDRKGIVTPNVLRNPDGSAHRVNGELVFYYTGVDMPGDYKHRIYRSTSADGLHWSAPSAPLIEDAYAPDVMFDGEKHRIWYVDVSHRPWTMRYAESEDGLKWNLYDKPVLVPLEQKWEGGDHLVYPAVIKQDGIFIMLYGSLWNGPDKTALGLAVSKDGKNWKKFVGNPVFMPKPSHDWESNFTTSETFMRLPDGSFRLWYASRPKPPFKHMYYAIGTAHWAGPGQ